MTAKIKHAQIIGAILFVLALGGVAVQREWNQPYDSQRGVNLAYHPIASTLGALAPAVILAPFVYWMLGWILRRNAARSKACEYCAETIKSEAKVCRYCGRDVAPAKQAKMQDRPLLEVEDQGGPDADRHWLECVQVPSATAARADTTSRPAGNDVGSPDGGSNQIISDPAAEKHDPANTVQQSALKGARSVLFGVAAVLAFGLLIALCVLWISGIVWASEKIVWYVLTTAHIAFWGCLLVLLPLSVFHGTRRISCFGILGASFIFGLCTWMLGVLTTYEYWGAIGVFVGLVLGIVGIVPLGILASIFHADWTSVIFLVMGLLLTYGARSFAAWLAIKIDREVSVVAGRAISAMDQGPESGKRQQSRALVTAGTLVLVTAGALALVLAAGWLGDTLRTPAPPSTPVTAGSFAEADAAYRRGDYATAIRLFRPLADRGNARAQNLLGSMYSNHQGVPLDHGEAVKWLRLAADQGLAAAQNNLGLQYRFGLGVPRDGGEEVKWFRLAADRGYADAQFNLGDSYLNSLGVPQNYAEAVKWLRLAADQGHAFAQSRLGVMYSTGDGVPRDDISAHMWFTLSAARESDVKLRDAQLYVRGLVEKHLTPEQIVEAQRRAAQWQPKTASSPIDQQKVRQTWPEYATSPTASTQAAAPPRTATAGAPSTTGSQPVKSVASGVESQVGGSRAWDRDCNALPVSITITRPPANGAISVLDGTVFGGGQVRSGSDPGGCVGRSMPGKKIMYRSKPGFHGVDGVTYETTYKSGKWSTTATINVQ